MSDTPEFEKIRALAQADRRVGACDTQEIARIRAALAAGPTPGPWRHDYAPRYCGELLSADGVLIARFTDEPSADDAEHTAACNPAAMTAVLAHIDAQAADMARVSAELGLPPTIGPAPGYLRYLMETNRAQAAEIERLRADAARYTYVIDKLGPYDIISRATDYFISNLRADTPSNKDSVDKAIDEAMKEQP